MKLPLFPPGQTFPGFNCMRFTLPAHTAVLMGVHHSGPGDMHSIWNPHSFMHLENSATHLSSLGLIKPLLPAPSDYLHMDAGAGIQKKHCG